MLKTGDSVMFKVGKISKVLTVNSDEFLIGDDKFVTLDGIRGYINVTSLVKVQSLFDKDEIQMEKPTEAELVEFHKERHVIDELDKVFLDEMKSHIKTGIEKLRMQNLRGVNIEIELMQFIRQQLK